MNFLVDENMPRTLAPQIADLGFSVQDVRDIGLRARPDNEVMDEAISADAIIITRDRGFANSKTWPTEFTAGMIFVDLPSNTPVKIVNARVLELIAKRLPVSLLGATPELNPTVPCRKSFVAESKQTVWGTADPAWSSTYSIPTASNKPYA